MADQLIDAEMARSFHTDACRASSLVAWAVMQDPPGYPDKVIARLITATPTVYVLVADTLAEIHAALPPNLLRTDRQPAHSPEVVEIWFANT